MPRTQRLRIYSAHGDATDLRVECPNHEDGVPLEQCLHCEAVVGLKLVDDAAVFLECKVQDDETDDRAAAGVPIAEVMTREVATVSPDTGIETVVWLLLQRGFGGAPVVDETRGLVGIITATDLLRAQTDDISKWGPPTVAEGEFLFDAREMSVRSLSGLTAKDVMTPVVHTLPDRAPLSVAAALMVNAGIHRLPVVSRDDPSLVVGVISSTDVMRWVARSSGYAGANTDEP